MLSQPKLAGNRLRPNLWLFYPHYSPFSEKKSTLLVRTGSNGFVIFPTEQIADRSTAVRWLNYKETE